jgi:ribonuclease R
LSEGNLVPRGRRRQHVAKSTANAHPGRAPRKKVRKPGKAKQGKSRKGKSWKT